MPSPAPFPKRLLQSAKRILTSCGAGEAMLLEEGSPGSPSGGDVRFLVRMEEERTLADIVPAEEELARLLGRPVFIIPVQTLHPDQARRLKSGGKSL